MRRQSLLLLCFALVLVNALPARDNFFGVHFLPMSSNRIKSQVTLARTLVGEGGYAKCCFFGITRDTQGAKPEWRQLIDEIYRAEMIPLIRLGGVYAGKMWLAPQPDAPGDYTSIAKAVARVIKDLPIRGPIYIEVWNEPNVSIEWTGKPNPEEYANFLVDVSRAIRALGDDRIKILNGGLATDPEFLEEMIKLVPDVLYAFDVLASHPYPHNHPPEYNIHDGTARYKNATIDSYLLELDVLKKYGRGNIKVMLTETGYALGDETYKDEGFPVIDEYNRADYIMRAFRDYWSKWDEILAVFPFEFCDTGSSGVWTNFDWVYPDTGISDLGFPTHAHLQYFYVAALAKPGNPWGAINGKVVERTSGLPIESALVEVPGTPIRCLTDQNGYYFLPRLGPTKYKVRVSKSGFSTAEATALVQLGINTVLNFKLTASQHYTLSGVVLDAQTKKPLAGAQITLQHGKHSAVSNEKGSFSFSGLVEGTYRLLVECKGYSSHAKDLKVLADTKIKVNLRKLYRPQGLVNMLTNSDMEEGEKSGVAIAWNNMDGKPHPDIYQLDHTTAASGTTSQKILGNPTPNNFIWQMTNYSSIKPHHRYLAQVWAKCEDVPANSKGVYLAVMFFTNDGRPLLGSESKQHLKGTSDWMLLELTLTAPERAERAQITLKIDAPKGTAWFDNVFFGELPQQ